MSNKVEIYCDGACSGNPGVGGWGAILFYGAHRKEISGREEHTTNNRMELMAAIESLKLLKKPSIVVIYTDSQYVQKGITEWIYNWQKDNWSVAIKKKIKNLDLWQELAKLTSKHQVTWQWVRGHSGIVNNEIADQLARSAIEKFNITN